MTNHHGSDANASVVVARDDQGRVAILSSHFANYGGEFIFLPGGRQEAGETAEECARRELQEEAGVTAESWRHLGTYAITLGSPARISLYLAEDLILGTQDLTESESDFKLSWWPLDEAIAAAAEGRYLLQGGPLALLLAQRLLAASVAES